MHTSFGSTGSPNTSYVSRLVSEYKVQETQLSVQEISVIVSLSNHSLLNSELQIGHDGFLREKNLHNHLCNMSTTSSRMRFSGIKETGGIADN